MTEPTSEVQPAPVVSAARDLRAIEQMASALAEEAANDSNARLMPGGKAMVLLGPHASLEAWGHMADATDRAKGAVTAEELAGGDYVPTRYTKAYTSAEDEDPEDHWDSLQLLLFWSESCRRELGEEYGLRPTLQTEAAYLGWRLEHLWQNEAGWDDFAADVRKARVRLESVLHDGNPPERSRVTCDCEDAPRLIRVHARKQASHFSELALEDGYKCPKCKRRFTQDDHDRMLARQLRSEGAERYVPVTDAVAMLRGQGRPERTIRKWLGVSDDHEDVVEGYCEVRTKRHHVWWPALWTRHLTTKTRKRAA